jgi:putative endonuclease
MTDEKDYHLYILLCDHKILYTGIAIDPQQRLKQHQQGQPYGAKFTRRFTQLELVYQIKVGSRAAAQSLEIKIKKLNTAAKQDIIRRQYQLPYLLELTS